MVDEKKFKRGDVVIKHGQAFKIIGASNGVIKYRPYFKKTKNNGLVGSIPVESIEGNYIRKPVSKTRQYQLIKEILYTPGKIKPSILAKIKADLGKNDFEKALSAIKKLWWEKKDKARTMTKSKDGVLKRVRRKVVEEIAVARKISIEQAREMLKRALRKGWEDAK
jgi:RNA polymerase-interacting CarD/CdnL/TRCF family regulator